MVCDDSTLAEIEERKGMVAVRYGNGRGKRAGGKWPANPNGSLNDIAGICDPTGRVFGLMPHPEGYYRASASTRTGHPDPERARRKGQDMRPPGPRERAWPCSNAVQAAREGLA